MSSGLDVGLCAHMEGQPWGLGQWWCIGLAWGWDFIIGRWSHRPGAFNCSSTCHPTYPTAFVHRVILAYNHSGVKANLEFERLSGCGRLLYCWCQVRLSTWARRSRPVVNLRFLCLQANLWLDIGLGTIALSSIFFARGSASVSWRAQLQSHLQILELCPGLDSQQSWP